MTQTDVATVDAMRADIGLVCALPLELAAFLGRCQHVKKYTGGSFTFRGGLYDGIRIAVVESGPGQTRAARATCSPRWPVPVSRRSCPTAGPPYWCRPAR